MNNFESLTALFTLDLAVLYFMSLLTFALFAIDKHQAVIKSWRIPEFLLLALSFLGGAFGALCAMILFAHKTKHKAFLICVPVFLFMQLSVDVLYRIFILS